MTLALTGCTIAEAAWRHRKYGTFHVEQREEGFVALREVAPHAYITLTDAVSFAQATARCRAEIERLDAEARAAKELQPCAL